jgi:hypothetical protein
MLFGLLSPQSSRAILTANGYSGYIFYRAARFLQGAKGSPTAAAALQYDCEIEGSALAFVSAMVGSDAQHCE